MRHTHIPIAGATWLLPRKKTDSDRIGTRPPAAEPNQSMVRRKCAAGYTPLLHYYCQGWSPPADVVGTSRRCAPKQCLLRRGASDRAPKSPAQAMRAGRARIKIMHASTGAAAAPADPQLHHPTGPAGAASPFPSLLLPLHSSPRSWKAGAGSAAEGSCAWPGVVGPCRRAGSRATGEWLQAPISAPSLPRLVSCWASQSRTLL